MKDFKSYSNERPDKKPDEGASGSAQSYNHTVELAKVLTKAMSGKNEGQILHTIIAEAERGKREGTLTNQDLDNFYTALSPFWTGLKSAN